MSAYTLFVLLCAVLACGSSTQSVSGQASTVSPIRVGAVVDNQACVLTLAVQENNGQLVTLVYGVVTELEVESPQRLELDQQAMTALFPDALLLPFAQKSSSELRLNNWITPGRVSPKGAVVLNGVANGRPQTFSGEFVCQN